MSPRSKTPRKVSKLPELKGFKPFGGNVGDKKLPGINLLLEEYEALRLCDYDHLNHQESAAMMSVSRPTFTRIYASALEKIAKSFVQGRTIIIEGGHVYFDTEWYCCNVCECRYNNPKMEGDPTLCPICGSANISLAEESESFESLIPSAEMIVFRCDQCGIEEEVVDSEANNIQLCNICHEPMTYKKDTGCGLKECL